MSQAVNLEVFYPYPPERVWQVLTDRNTLATWMMKNDFEPKLGHRFRFYNQLLPGLDSTIQCEVVELEAPTRLVYTWRESPMAEPSLVVWTLTTVTGGTQLRLKHHQYSYAKAGASLNGTGLMNAKQNFERIPRFHHQSGLFDGTPFPPTSVLETPPCPSTTQNTNQFKSLGRASTLTLSDIQSLTWDYWLNQRLLDVLEKENLT